MTKYFTCLMLVAFSLTLSATKKKTPLPPHIPELVEAKKPFYILTYLLKKRRVQTKTPSNETLIYKKSPITGHYYFHSFLWQINAKTMDQLINNEYEYRSNESKNWSPQFYILLDS